MAAITYYTRLLTVGIGARGQADLLLALSSLHVSPPLLLLSLTCRSLMDQVGGMCERAEELTGTGAPGSLSDQSVQPES